MHRLILIVLLFTSSISFAQHIYSGYVYDAQNGEALPFVNIIADNQKSGYVSDIDGRFKVISPQPVLELKFFFIGYEPHTLLVSSQKDPEKLHVNLKRKPIGLSEVVIIAGENPAHRIINKVIANRQLNDPENLSGFTYESYNKLIVTADSIDKASPSKLDSSAEATKRFFNSSHLFLSESVTKRMYRYKGFSNEKVLASRVSGLKNPIFTLLGTQFQSFTFYKDYITVSDKNYLNPLSPNSISKYIFVLEDTTYSGNDTIYQIHFQPRPGKNIEGLKGVLYINTHGYAVQNVIAEPAEKVSTHLKIQQLYEQINGKWFPVQLNTDIIFGMLVVNGRQMRGNARTYLSNIQIGEPAAKNEFSEVIVEVEKDAMNKDQSFWNAYRKDSLTQKDQRTYHVIDSIGKEAKLEEKITLFNSFMTGRYPIGMIDLDLNRIIDYNDHEGYRLGAGIFTNQKISGTFTIGGYAAYGTNDNTLKYGGSLSARVKKIKDGNISIEYRNDVIESGNQGEFLRKQSLLAEDYRRLSINMMDKIESYTTTASFRILKYLHTAIALDHFERTPHYVANEQITYSSTEIKAMFRYVYREKFMQLLGDPISLGSDKPVIWLSFSKGVNGLLEGNYDYLRTDMMVKDKVLIRNTGNFQYTIKAGDLSGVKGIPFDYHLRGANTNWSLYDEESFQTMGINEFFTQRYLNIFLKHDFGKLLFKTKYFSPSLAVTSSYGLFSGKTRFDTPYLESGLLIQDILNVSIMKLGIGGFYRYGAHHLPSEEDNITIKTVFRIGF